MYREGLSSSVRWNDPFYTKSSKNRENLYFRYDFQDLEEIEVSPNDNAVIMEEQLIKISESSMNFKLASSIYSKNLSMFKMALNGTGR